MANGNELKDLANKLRSEENLSTSQVQRDPRYIAKQEEIAERNRVSSIERGRIAVSEEDDKTEATDSQVLNKYLEARFNGKVFDRNSTIIESVITSVSPTTGATSSMNVEKPRFDSDEKFENYLIERIPDNQERDVYKNYLKTNKIDIDPEFKRKIKNEIQEYNLQQLYKTKTKEQRGDIRAAAPIIQQEIKEDIGEIKPFITDEKVDKFSQKSIDFKNNYSNVEKTLKEINEEGLKLKQELKPILDRKESIEKFGAPESWQKELKRIEVYNNKKQAFVNTDEYKNYIKDAAVLNKDYNFLKNSFKAYNNLVEEADDIQLVLNAASKDYLRARQVGDTLGKFFFGDIPNFFTGLVKQGYTEMKFSTSPITPGITSLLTPDLVDELNKNDAVYNFFDSLHEKTDNYTNEYAKKLEVKYPKPLKVKDIDSLSSFATFVLDAGTVQSPSIATMMIPMGVVARGASALKTITKAAKKSGKWGGAAIPKIAAQRIKNLDNAVLARNAAGSIFYTSSTGSEMSRTSAERKIAPIVIGNLEKEINDESVPDWKKSNLKNELEAWNRRLNISEGQSFIHSNITGAAEGIGERFGTLTQIGRLSRSAFDTVEKSLLLNAYNTAFKGLGRAIATEFAEETITQTIQDYSKKIFFDPTITIFDNLDADFFATVAATRLIIAGGNRIQNVKNVFADYATTRNNKRQSRELFNEALEIESQIDDINAKLETKGVLSLNEIKRLKNEKTNLLNKQSDLLEKNTINRAISMNQYKKLTPSEREILLDIESKLSSIRVRNSNLASLIADPAEKRKALQQLKNEYESLIDKKDNILKNNSDRILKKQLQLFNNIDGVEVPSDNKSFELDFQYLTGLNQLEIELLNVYAQQKGLNIKVGTLEEIKQWSKENNLNITDELLKGKSAGIVGNSIFVNQELVDTQIFTSSFAINPQAAYAAVSPIHEILHHRLQEVGFVDSKYFEQASNELFDMVELAYKAGNIKEADYKTLMRRKNRVQKGEDNKTKLEEFIIAYNDSLRLGFLSKNDLNTSVYSRIFFNSIASEALGDLGITFKIKTGGDLKNFLDNFNKNVNLNKQVGSRVEEPVEEKIKVEKFSKAIGDQIKALVPSGTTKQQYDNQVIGDVYTDLVVGNTLNGLIRGQLNKFGVTGDNVFGKPINNFVEDVKQQLFERSLTRFNPETNDDLGGFVVSELQQFRIGDVVNRYRREQTGSLDVQIGETGSIRTPVADEVDIDIKTTEDPRSELKQGLIVNNERLVDKKLEGEIEANTIEIIEGVTPEINDKDFKTFVKDAAQQKSFKSIKNKLKNIEQFLEDNINVLFGGKNLPIATLVAMERRTPAADRIFTGEPTRLTTQKQIDKAIDEGDFYVENEKQGPSKYPRKKPTIEQVKNFFFNVGASTKGTRKDGLVNAIAFSLFRDMAPGVMNRSNIVQEDIAKISAKLVVDPRVKFSEAVDDIINIRGDFNLDEKGIDRLLENLKLDETFDLKKSDGRIKFVDVIKKNLLPLMPKEFWFSTRKDGKVTGSAFTASNKTYGLSMGNKEEADTYNAFKDEIFAIGNNPETKFGKPIQYKDENEKTITVDLKSVTKNYKTIFGDKTNYIDKIVKGFKDGSIDTWNKNVAAIHKEMWKRFNKALNSENRTAEAQAIGTYLKLVANDTSSWHKLGAQLVGYSKELQQRKEGKAINIEFEHAMPATAAYLYLMDAALQDQVDFNTAYDLVVDNYKLIVLDKAMDDKLRNARTASGYSLQRRMPDDWSVIEGNWWQRYFNDIVYAQDGGIDPSSIIGLDGRTFSETFEVDAAGRSTNKNIETSKKKAFKSNLKQPNVKKYSFSKSAEGLINDLNNHDKALRNARDLNAPKKGISIFDFDDTVATSKSMIIVTMPDGKTKKITPAEFAKQHSALEKQDAEFDFSEFNKVIDGKPGPLAAKIKKQIDKFGNKDVYILTARPQASASAIKAFLDGIGIKLPLKNITGLEDGTPQAKANWVIGKAAEGYNDFYFTDDVYKNVKAVQQALEVLDVKSKTRLAYADRIKKLDKDFNDILEATKGVASEKEYSKVKAELLRGNKGRYEFFIHASADDFAGMLQRFQGKGVVGDNAKLWFKKNLLDPFATAMGNLSRERIALMNDYDALKKQIGIVPKNLRKKMGEGIFTNEHAVRVYIWNKQGMEVPGLSKRDLKELTKYINDNKKFKVFADQLIAIHKADKYPKPDSAWSGGTITIDMQNGLDVSSRAKNLQVWEQNVDIIFSDKNLNKIEALYGQPLREALTGMIKRMKTGKNRSFQSDTLTGKTVDFLNGAVGGVMFFNSRSSVLQTISLVNFINYEDNNIFAASKAFANQKQFWKDFKNLMNSDFLIDRRRGVRFSLNENDIANIAQKHGARGVIARALEIGFLPTQIADSFAIAVGGASFYRNRINTYKKQGLSDQQAEAKAFQDFREIAEETQQSSRPDRVSQQQAGPMGRLLLAFQNVTMQFNRVGKKNFLDLKNKRRVLKSDGTFHSLNKSRQIQLSKMGYYFFVQNLIFNGLQRALFALYFGDVDEEDEKFKNKYIEIANSMGDSILRGLGIFGGVVSVLKNAAIMYQKQAESPNPKYEKVGLEILKVSPPISSKITKVVSALRTLDWEKEEIKEKGFSIDNPALLSATKLISAFTNAPLDRVVIKTNNIATALGQQLELWERIALLGGWQAWELGIEDEPKSIIKRRKTKQRKVKKRKTK